jgi:hypothetical protein
LFSSIAQGHSEHNGNNQRTFEILFSIHQMCFFYSNVLPPTPQPKKAKKNLVDVHEEQIEINGASTRVGHSQNKEPLLPSPAPNFKNVPHPWVYLKWRSS